MPLPLILSLALIVIMLFAIKWVKNSKLVDKFTTDITEEKDFSEPATKDVIAKIGKAETGLGERAKEQKGEADKLTKESDSIQEYLDKRDLKDKDEDKGVNKEDMPMK